MPRFGVQLLVLGLEGAEGGGGFVVAADGGAEAREEWGEDGGGGVGGWGCMVEDEGWGGDAEVMVRWCWTGID